MTELERQELAWTRYRLGSLAHERLARGLTPEERTEWRELADRELELLRLELDDET